MQKTRSVRCAVASSYCLKLSVQVSVQWHEGKVRVRASVLLPAAAEEDALPSMLSSLFQSLHAMQVPTSLLPISLPVTTLTGCSAPMLFTSKSEPAADDCHLMLDCLLF